MNGRFWNGLALDALAGFCTLIVLVLAAVALHTINHPAFFLAFGAAVCVATAWLRACWYPSNQWLQGVAMAIAACLPVFLVGRWRSVLRQVR
jgi:membrane protein implicated in regulation of membrane protease activity